MSSYSDGLDGSSLIKNNISYKCSSPTMNISVSATPALAKNIKYSKGKAINVSHRCPILRPQQVALLANKPNHPPFTHMYRFTR